ncbi:MAG: hypothetical protein ACRBF0_10070 [Calditrichia bacterium]
MPIKEFLEEYPLYKKYTEVTIPISFKALAKDAVKMHCPNCSEKHTFNWYLEHHYGHYSHIKTLQTGGQIVRCVYLCTHCSKFKRYFAVKIADDRTWFMKVGQFPPWDISGNINIENILGEYANFYKKGLINESQGYGIGAFGYYRRIVEETIDKLLDEITELIVGDKLAEYQTALDATKKTTITTEKINLVKDLLPPILRPDGMNPLSELHSTLSDGLHARSDDECLKYAATCREILVFLVDQVAASREAAKSFTQNMKKLLERKSKRLPEN